MNKMIHLPDLNTRARKAFALALVLGAGTVSQASLTLPEDLLPSLDESLGKALTQSPQIMARNAHDAASMADVTTAKAARLPYVVASGSWSTGEENQAVFVEPRATDKLYYSLTLNQSLYHWGTIKKSIQSAKIRQRIQEGNTKLAYLSLVGSVRANYLRLIRKKRELEKLELELEINEAQLATTRAKHERNEASEADLFLSQLSRDKAEVALLVAKDSFETDLDLFSRLVGGRFINETDIPTSHVSPDFATDLPILRSLASQFLGVANPTNTEIANAEKQIEIDQNTLHAYRMALRPKFDLLAGTTQDEREDTVLSINRYEYRWTYAGVSVYWPLFDGLASRGRTKAALQRLRANELELQMDRDQLQGAVESALRSVERLALLVSIEDKQLASAESALAYATEQLARGDASQAAVDSAQLKLHDAALAQMLAGYYYWSEMTTLLELTEMDPVLDRMPSSRK